MPVFISFSFENKPEFDNIADALKDKGIEHWAPGSLRAGAPLADQLRESILACELCVFVATRHSVQSSWCGAELGAFWGVGKPVIIYVAEASLSEQDMPKQFQGHLTERRIARVVDAVQEFLAKSRNAAAQAPDQLPNVGSMTVEDLRNLVTEAVSRIQDANFVATTLSRVAVLTRSEGAKGASADHRELRELMTDLLGVRGNVLRDATARLADWKYMFRFSTDTGEWIGVAQSHHEPPTIAVDIYDQCLAWRVGEKQRVEAVAALQRVVERDLDVISTGEPYLIVGRGALGAVPARRPD
jgi:TIR domain